MGHIQIHKLSGNYVFYVIFSMYIHKISDASPALSAPHTAPQASLASVPLAFAVGSAYRVGCLERLYRRRPSVDSDGSGKLGSAIMPRRAFRAHEARVAPGACGAKVRVAVDGGSGRRVLGRPDRMGGAVDSDGGGAVVIRACQNSLRYLSTPVCDISLLSL